MSLDALQTHQTLRDCQFTPQQAQVLTALLLEREAELVSKEDSERQTAELKGSIDQLRADTERGIDQLRVDTERSIDQLRADTKRSIDQLRTDTERSIDQLRVDTERSIDQLRADTERNLEHGLAEVRRHADANHNEALLQLARVQRELMIAMIAVAGVVIAAAGLFAAFL